VVSLEWFGIPFTGAVVKIQERPKVSYQLIVSDSPGKMQSNYLQFSLSANHR